MTITSHQYIFLSILFLLVKNRVSDTTSPPKQKEIGVHTNFLRSPERSTAAEYQISVIRRSAPRNFE